MEITLEKQDLEELKLAVSYLEQDTLTEKITQVIGSPVEYLMRQLPESAVKTIYDVVEKALFRAADTALWSLENEPEREASTTANKFFAGLSGAIGGAFGLSALTLELPVSTTIMLRAVADIARSEGFDLEAPETKLSCLEVFALGNTSPDSEIEVTYYEARGYTAAVIEDISDEFNEGIGTNVSANATKNMTSIQTSKWLTVFIEKIATRFCSVVMQKAAAQAVPVVGAISGATLNSMFTDFYQDMARGHFMVKKLENKYGFEMIKTEYEQLANAGPL